jgi:acyl-CoA synthetase (NDP forming)
MAEKQVQQYTHVVKAAVKCAAGEKPVVVFSHISGGLDPTLKTILADGGVPFLQGTRQSLCALDHLAAYAKFQAQQSTEQMPAGISPQNLQAVISRLTQCCGVLSYSESKSILQAYGINVPADVMTHTIAEAAEAARKIGYPIVMKGQSPDVPHKTEAGLVRLNIEDASQLRRTFDALKKNLYAYDPGATFEGVLIQQMITPDAVETILGISRDPVFGPTIVLGLGGVFVELVKDAVLKLPPLSHAEALNMIRSLKGRKVLEGFRGKPFADIDALADTIVQLARMAVDLKGVLSALDLNPLMVLPQGQGVVAADVLMECAPVSAQKE